MSNINYDYDYERENEARLEYEAQQQAEAEAMARNEAEQYERMFYEDPQFQVEQLVSVFAFSNFGEKSALYINWLFDIQINLI